MIDQLFVLDTGFCSHPECSVIKGGSWRPIRFPANVVVMAHRRQGIVLFDAGYAPRLAEATRRGLPRLYGKAIPVTHRPEQAAVEQLRQLGIAPSDVRHIILSHFHADHIGGVSDFPKARLHFRDAAYADLQHLGALNKVLHGFLPSLLPRDFAARAAPLASGQRRANVLPFKPFTDGYDLFGDGSIVAVDLPGHAPGHLGLAVRGASEPYLFIGDAAWLQRSITEKRMPSAVTRLIIDDFATYRTTLAALHHFHKEHPQVHLVPCHCIPSNAPLLRSPATSASLRAGAAPLQPAALQQMAHAAQ